MNKQKNTVWKKHLVSIIILALYYILVALFVQSLGQNANNPCGTGSASLIILWAIVSIIIALVLVLVMAFKKGFSAKEYLIVLALTFIPVLIAIKWFFF